MSRIYRKKGTRTSHGLIPELNDKVLPEIQRLVAIADAKSGYADIIRLLVSVGMDTATAATVVMAQAEQEDPAWYMQFENQVNLVVNLTLQIEAQNPVPVVISHK